MNSPANAPLARSYLRGFVLGLYGFLAITICLVFAFQWISADAPYYLSLARDIHSGNILYKDAVNAYTPLVIYFFSFLFTLMAEPSYSVFLGCQLLVIFVDATILYLILRKQGVESLLSLFVSLIFSVVVLSSDGHYINLECYSVLFVLSACYLALFSNSVFWCGVLLGCSFLCKQYGVLNFIPIAYLVLTSSPVESRFRKLIILGLGGFVAVLALVVILALQGVSIVFFLKQISGMAYASYSVARTRSFLSVLIGAKVLLLALVMPVYYLVSVKRVDRMVLFCLIGVIVNLVPAFIQSFQHYFINAIPFALLLSGYILNEQRSRRYLILFGGAAVIAGGLFVSRLFRYSDVGGEQTQTAAVLRQHIVQGGSVFIEGPLRYLYFLNDYRNPLVDKIGYDYTFYGTKEWVESSGDYVILSNRLYETQHVKLETSSGEAYIYP